MSLFDVVKGPQQFTSESVRIFGLLKGVKGYYALKQFAETHLKPLWMLNAQNCLAIQIIIDRLIEYGTIQMMALKALLELTLEWSSEKNEEAEIITELIAFSGIIDFDAVTSFIDIQANSSITMGDVETLANAYKSTSAPPISLLRSEYVVGMSAFI